MEKISIEAIRVNNNLTREQIANKLGISLDRYNRIVQGKSKLLATEFIKIHELFDIPFEQININNS